MPLVAQNATYKETEKIYVSPENVVINKHGIFVITEEGIVGVQGVLEDSQGLYYNAYKFSWTCPRCHHENPWYKTHCEVCGY